VFYALKINKYINACMLKNLMPEKQEIPER
jgi:hypothetical protein